MTLLLTSQGLPSEIKKTFLTLLPKTPKNIKVSFITTASYGEVELRQDWLDVYIKQLNECGINKIEELDIRHKTQVELRNILKNKDIIFVNGGNTFFLLYWIKKTGFYKLLPQLLNQGKLYIDISAGSYIACPTIEQANWKHQDKNKIDLRDLSALNLVPFLLIAHFEEKYRTIIENSAKTTKYPVIALSDTQAILVKDGKWKLVGRGKKEFFNGFKEN